MQLTQEELEIFNGEKGPVMQKLMQTIVRFGDCFGAKKLVNLDGPMHLVNTTAMAGLDSIYDILDQLIEAGFKTKQPFTTDPWPMDMVNIKTTDEERAEFLRIYEPQERYLKQLLALGLINEEAFSCACYLPQIGNIPKEGQRLAWAESSAVVYVNSVLGARTNRNSAYIELFCNILGKAPEFGLLKDENRKAPWLVDIQTSKKPNGQVLGSVIGRKVVEDVPYIIGLDRFLTDISDFDTQDYLKDLGAAAASNGAVGLFHVENVTPEALRYGRKLLLDDYQTFVVTDQVIEDTVVSYPVLWNNKDDTPVLCLIGCPHLSLNQVNYWYHQIEKELNNRNMKSLAVQTVLLTAKPVISEFKKNPDDFEKLSAFGVTLSNTCPIMYMNNPLCASRPVITNSNKARTYSTSRFFEDSELLDIIVSGKIKGGKNE